MDTETTKDLFDSNTENIEYAISRLDNVIEQVVDVKNGMFQKTAFELKSFLEEYKNYNELGKEDNMTLVDVNFYSIIRNYEHMRNLSREKKNRKYLKFVVNGNDTSDPNLLNEPFTIHNCMASMKLVPTQLIDNAYKYAPDDTTIVVSFESNGMGKKISFQNLGPRVEDNEISDILYNKRGKNAIKTGVQGQGIGLNVVSSIFDSHKWLFPAIGVASAETTCSFGKVDYSPFVISLNYDDTDNENEIKRYFNPSDDLIFGYLIHEFIRISPNLCKDAALLYRHSKSTEAKSAKNQEELVRLCYEIKDAVIENYVDLVSTIEDFPIRKTGSYTERFDKLVISELNYANCYYNKNAIITLPNQKHKSVLIYPPMIDVFVHIFGKNLIACIDEGSDIVITEGSNYMEFSSDSDVNIKDVELMNYFIQGFNMEMVVEKNYVSINF